ARTRGIVTLGPHWDAVRRRIFFQETPFSLLGAIWLQLVSAINGDVQSRRCENCGRWLELTPGKNRSHRLTCSQTCRNRLYLNRQAHARKLRAAGKSVKQIAKQLPGSDETTIRKWLTQ